MNKISHKFTAVQPLLTEGHFCAWIGQSAPGAVIEYHRGFLAIDTVRASSDLLEPERKELVRVGRRAWWACEHTLVHLVQRRLGPDCFSYLAIVRARPKESHATLLTLLAQDPAAGVHDPNISLRQSRS